MVIRYKNKDGTGGVLMSPLTPEERRWLRHHSTVDHGGPYIRIGPRSVGPAASSTNRHMQATSRSAAEAAVDQTQPSPPPEKRLTAQRAGDARPTTT
jgi:hypothetical protein